MHNQHPNVKTQTWRNHVKRKEDFVFWMQPITGTMACVITLMSVLILVPEGLACMYIHPTCFRMCAKWEGKNKMTMWTSEQPPANWTCLNPGETFTKFCTLLNSSPFMGSLLINLFLVIVLQMIKWLLLQILKNRMELVLGDGLRYGSFELC